jgi:ABC-type transporter Mla subunit MlaD
MTTTPSMTDLKQLLERLGMNASGLRTHFPQIAEPFAANLDEARQALLTLSEENRALRELLSRALAYLPSTLSVTRDVRTALHAEGERE